MKKLAYLFQISILGGVYQSIRCALKGIRFHPTARIVTSNGRVQIGKGTKIGRNCIITATAGGEVQIGSSVWLYRDVEIHSDGGVMFIGDGTTMQKDVTLRGDIRIGTLSIFAPNVFVSSGTHIFDYRPNMPIREQEALYRKENGRFSRPVEIGDDCWLGINVAVMPGLVIGSGSIIGANAVVTASIPKYSVAVGIPAKPVRTRR